ncbi:MAG: multiheme c-type cytochrome [Campylobacterales bacterium]|nr:multiheme c-type cytochrome [Campylobacterales bacterium]
MIKTPLFFIFLFFSTLLFSSNTCVDCHKETQKIRDESSGMMKAILELSQKAGHVGNDCIVCHGGNPEATKKEKAHSGTPQYFKSNKGPKEFYSFPSNHEVNKNTCGICHENQVSSQKNSLMMSNQETIGETLKTFGVKSDTPYGIGMHKTENPHARVGTDAYQEYMQKLQMQEPQVFTKEINKLPSPATVKEVQKEPSLAAFAYLNQENSSKNMGCASCHLPKTKDGHLVHSIQSSRDTSVKVDGKEYSGVSVETCATCHNREKSIATSYQGLLEKESPSSQKYIHMQEDIHFKKGMLCQDCHTSNDLHGDGFLSGATTTAVEVECQDCHGTTNSYPWELPLGYSDEFNTTVVKGKARGIATTVAEYLKQGSVEEAKEGYLLSARGNPLPHAIKEGNKISLHLANGKNIELSPLKELKKEKKLSQKALLAMDEINAHTKKMECYTCHASWVRQDYDTHLKMDYSDKSLATPKVMQSKAFMRWEEPTLMQNAEGRISPSVPKYLSEITVIGKDFSVDIQTPHAKEMLAIQPHTMQKEARSCESCHTTLKAMDMKISGLRVSQAPEKPLDVNTTQTDAFKFLAPLSQVQRDKLDRSGMCISCHQDIPKGNLAISAMSHMAKMADINIDNDMHKTIVNKALKIGVWAQVLGGILIAILLLLGIYITFFKKQPRNPRNEGWK